MLLHVTRELTGNKTLAKKGILLDSMVLLRYRAIEKARKKYQTAVFLIGVLINMSWYSLRDLRQKSSPKCFALLP